MRLNHLSKILLVAGFAASPLSLQAALSMSTDSGTTTETSPASNLNTAMAPTKGEGPAGEAIEAFKAGNFGKAVELAQPLAEKGNADALYLLGFAYESGQGVDRSKEKALENYRRAATIGNKDAVYRLSIILLASDKKEERDQAKQALEKAAKDDPGVASRILGEAYLRGLLSEKPDPETGISWWKRGADAGDITSIQLVARFYEGQFGFPEKKNLKESINYYTKAAEQGDASTMVVLGSRLLSGDPSIRDEKKGREWLKNAIAAKDYTAYLVLGDFEEHAKKNLKTALEEYERGKDAGQIDCMLRTADFYYQGKGADKDTSRAMGILTKAADAGSAAANLRLAVQLLSAEKPVATDVITGYGRLLLAANGELPEAQNELALFYLSGKFGAADMQAGVAWLTRAAKAGNALAQNNLATIFERGIAGLPRNFEAAGQLYALAANQGHAAATLALARMLNEGRGIKADPVKAWALASLATERGEKDGEALAKDIASKLDAKQLEAAKKELSDIKSGKKSDDEKAEKPAPSPAPQLVKPKR